VERQALIKSHSDCATVDTLSHFKAIAKMLQMSVYYHDQKHDVVVRYLELP
jgi:hypothetical protein